MTWFRETKAKKGQFMPIVGTFVTDKADAEQIGTVLAVIAEGLVRALCHSIALPLPPAHFVLESGSFKNEE